MNQSIIHATSVLFCGQGILIRGPSGSGKSDLALRLIDAGGTLIADDRTELTVKNSELFASPPPTIAGLLEIRGVGLRKFPYAQESRVALCLDCTPRAQIPRMPEKEEISLLGVAIPLYRIDPFEAAVVAKIRAILQTSPAHD